MKLFNRSNMVQLAIGSAAVIALMAVKLQAAPVSVYWTDRNAGTLNKTDVSSGNTAQLVTGGSRFQDVDLNAATNTLFYADWGAVGSPGGQGSINRVGTDGSGQGLVLGTGDAVHQLALDAANQRIYFTRAVSYDSREISRVQMDGSGYTKLTAGSGNGTGAGTPIGWFFSGLALDAVNNLLYWGDPGVLNNPPNGSVNRMTTAGGAPTQLTPHVNGRGRGMALDTASNTLFYTSHDQQSPGTGGGLFSYNILTGVESLLISDTGTGYWDIEIDPFAQRVWYTDYGRGQIWSARFDGSDARVELSGLTNPYGLALEFAPAAPIPEPTSMALFGLTAVGMGVANRRRRRRGTADRLAQ